MSSASRSVYVLLLALLATLLFASLPSASAQSVGCYPCVVNSCAAYFNGSAPNVSIGATSSAGAAAECTTLNTDIAGFIATAQNTTCAASVTALACEVIAAAELETACNTSTIGLGTPLGNQTVFEQQCAAVAGCLGYTYQDEVAAAGACASFDAFLTSIIAQPAPSTVPCAPCNITSCYGLSTIGVTDVTFWAGSLPGYTNGSACAAQQAVAANLLANGKTGVDASIVAQTVCDPLAALTLLDSQAACNAGDVDEFFDAAVFSASTAHNLTWEEFCEPSLSEVFDATLVSRLVAVDYCVSPAAGLTAYAELYIVGAPSNSTTAGCYPCVVNACASFFNGTAPSVSIGSPSAADAAAECTTLNTDIVGFYSSAQNATCAASITALACDVIVATEETEKSCNTSTIGVGTALANQTLFQQTCAATVGCLGYTYQDELVAADACYSFESFLGTIIAAPTPSAVPCAPCNITACYGLSTIGVTDVTFWSGSLPGTNGSSACANQQIVGKSLLANGNPNVDASLVQQTVCNPLAALTLIDSQMACNAGTVDELFDAAVFSLSTSQNMTWESYCAPTLSAVFDASIGSQLLADGFCVSPATALTAYGNTLLAAPGGGTTSSSSSGAAPSASASSAASSSSAASAAAATTSSSSSAAAATTTAASSSSAATQPSTPSSSTAAPIVGGPSSSSAAPSTPTAPTSTIVASSTPVIVVASSSSGPSGLSSANGAGTVRPLTSLAVFLVSVVAAASLLL